MTHDELIKKILIKVETEMFQDTFDGYATGDSSLSRALFKVVELHKPSENYTGSSCQYCFNLAYEPTGLSMDYEDFAYPCATIQAIEKELS
jgi:hypothetical protein